MKKHINIRKAIPIMVAMAMILSTFQLSAFSSNAMESHSKVTLTQVCVPSENDNVYEAAGAVDGKKIEINARKGHQICLYVKASNASKALGIFQEINYNSDAVEFVGFISAEGSYMYAANEANKLKWNSLLDADGSDFTDETDVAVIEFKALTDIKSTDNVMAYNMIEFYDIYWYNFDTDKTIRCVAVSDSDSDTDSETDTDSNTDSDTDTNTDTDDDIISGDVNNDGRVTVSDAIITLKAALNIISLDARQTKAADIDFNNKVNVSDAVAIQKISLSII